ncbi:MAG: RnfABCDGE type electron transport complex subunit D [Defluviitaleaceae bacterium]|nr:RnfABCDGE type electron transport complex subunit D [Defluviitaleaceae bacterium]MCL2239695.1 RnfABCDGE type electron transport complex subunit D [Defluviitaleaceae bacterium]
MEQPRYIVTTTPHIRSRDSIERTMLFVLIALAPAAVLGVVFFGVRALFIILISVTSAVCFEALYQKLARKPVTVTDGSAVVTGLLLALILPPGLPLWMPVVGAFAAIVLVKQLFGGLGHNFLNPALAARAMLMAAYALPMTVSFTAPRTAPDATASATPLMLLESGEFTPAGADFLASFLGNVGGSIGETSAVALLAGGVFLLATKVISWHIPVSFIASAAVFTALFHPEGFSGEVVGYHMLAGGLILGAFFMATDYPTSPVTPLGKILFGVGCGVITMVIRLYGGFPEGVAYAILLMNLTVPLIDRYIRPHVLGKRAKAGQP